MRYAIIVTPPYSLRYAIDMPPPCYFAYAMLPRHAARQLATPCCYAAFSLASADAIHCYYLLLPLPLLPATSVMPLMPLLDAMPCCHYAYAGR